MSTFIEKHRRLLTIGLGLLSFLSSFGISRFSQQFYGICYDLGINSGGVDFVRHMAGLIPAFLCLYVGKRYLIKPSLKASVLVIALCLIGATSANMIGSTLLEKFIPHLSDSSDPQRFERKDDLSKDSIQKSGLTTKNSAAYIVGPLEEEIIFRFLLVGMILIPLVGPMGGILGGACIFGFAHLLAYRIDSIPSMIFSGLILGLVYLMFGLRYSILLHAMFNFLAIFIRTSTYSDAMSHLHDHFIYEFSLLMIHVVPLCVFIFYTQEFIRRTIRENIHLSGSDTGNP